VRKITLAARRTAAAPASRWRRPMAIANGMT
jgi:hypothetical protein